MRVLFSYKGRKKNGRVAGEFVVIAVLKMLESQQQRENSAAGAGTPLKNHVAGRGAGAGGCPGREWVPWQERGPLGQQGWETEPTGAVGEDGFP